MKKYIDLGLPSGTKWSSENEKDYYTYDEAVEKFRTKLPTRKQFKELIDLCSCEWDNTNRGCIVTGPNGNSIFLPAAGARLCYGRTYYVRSRGFYWSSTSIDLSFACHLDFYSSDVYIDFNNRCCKFSVRLVKK